MLIIPLHGVSCTECGLPVERLRISARTERHNASYRYNVNVPCGCVLNVDHEGDVNLVSHGQQ